MKKIVSTVLVFILLLCLKSAVSVYAAGVKEPTIETQMSDCYGIVGESEIKLFTNASSPDGGTLEYQWYSTTMNNIATIRAIDDEIGTTFTPPQTVGVVYYCYAVWNIRSGLKSQPVYSQLVRVEYAAGVQEPTIESQMPDCYGTVGESEIMLFTNATSPDGGTLEYQWYSTTMNNIATIRAIDDEIGTTFTPPQTVGVVYYCYAVWNIKYGIKSQPVYSRLIRVEFDENKSTTIEILSAPDKVVYTAGESLDLTGLKVRIWTSDGYIDSVNGDKLEITKNPLVTVGEQKIKVAYGDAFDIFIVTVKEAPHTHSFGEWMVTTKATCTEAGIKTRECDCGQTERAEIPATGHKWDEGKVTKESTKTSDGEMTFACTVCKVTKTEIIKASGIVSDPTKDTASTEKSESTEAPHTHSFGEWMVTTKATCTETGIKTRKCDCGQTEQAEIPETGHKWDEGKVTKELTETSDGEMTFACTVCKATKTEIIEADESISASNEDTASTENSESMISTRENETSGENQPLGIALPFGFHWWIINGISAVMLIGGGAVIAGVIIRKKKK